MNKKPLRADGTLWIGFANEGEIPKLKALWHTCFGDEWSYIDFYFANGFCAEQTVVLKLADEPVAMLTLLPVTLQTPRGQHRGQYVYAVATAPEHRGKGLMQTLMTAVDQAMTANGDDFLCLVPASKSLFSLYERVGYQTCSTLAVETVDPIKEGDCRIKQLTKETYFALRKDWLLTQPATITFTDDGYLQQELGVTATETLWVETPLGDGFAAVYKAENQLLVRESSLTKEALMQASGMLCARYDCQTLQARLRGHGHPYGMMKSLTDKALPKDCYMNLMLD